MPVVIPESIPAYTFLKEHAFIMGESRAQHQDIRPLEVLIVNLMPTKIETENQILSLLANSPLQVNITLLSTESYIGTNTPKSHLDRFYVNFSDIKGKNFDGAIVTGAPVGKIDYEQVKYWSEFVEITNYLKLNSTSTIYLCWGALAALYNFYGIKKVVNEKKLFGVFEHYHVNNDVVLRGLDEIVRIPHSRYSALNSSDLENAIKDKKLKVLLEGKESGATILKDNKDLYILGHAEYARETLLEEYKRDLSKGIKINPPENYLDSSGSPIWSWRSSASVLFSNWLNFSVYQDTPYNLDNKIEYVI